jgi:hypothetical protein
MDKFLDACIQTKLNQKYYNKNSPITCNEIEAVIKSLITNKNQGLNELMVKLYQTFKEELIPIFLNIFKEIEREETR